MPKDFRTPWTYTMTKELKKELFSKPRQYSFTAPKNELFALIPDIKPFLTMKKKQKEKNTVTHDLHRWNGITENVY